MAQFAMLLTLAQNGKYAGMCDIVNWSIKDEMVHCLGNCWLFRTFISENPDIWTDELKYDIYQAIREIVAQEDNLIDYLKPPQMDKDLFKQYVRFRANFVLQELGMKKEYPNITTNPIPYMDTVTVPLLADFFSARVVEYTTEGKDWGSLR